MTRRKAAVLASALLLSLGAGAQAAPATADTPRYSTGHRTSHVIDAIEHSAHTLRSTEPEGSLQDLHALGRMVGDADVVGLGEATHGSRDFFRMKHRVFRYLVEEKGFRTFSLELPWSSGLRVNEYVLYGKGDLDRIAREEFQGSYRIWNNADYLNLIRWMRTYNRHHPTDPVHFAGNDMGYAGPESYRRVTDEVARTHPHLKSRITALYAGLAPATDAGTYMERYLELPLAERKQRAKRTLEAYELLRDTSGREHPWTVQHAKAIHQMAQGYAYDITDDAQVTEMMRYRDRVMAENVAWWHEHTADRILLSAHNTHVSYDSFDARYPKTQGAFLHDTLGDDYVSIGFSFHSGAFKAFGTDDNVMRTYRVGAAPPDSNEHTLDQPRRRDYILDLRTAPRAVRAWLSDPRPTWNIGAGWPDPTEYRIALGKAHDILIHLNEVEATTYLGRP
ncbi:erythromycin esterase family protein [Streptomyces edwardsiae]|uniref:Erythromycin esterase family protein n=1 Tax=Streptomyces edwardsiae TaxID=3075527 RepID=A0ABU2QC92_9ACTN|nr:erythromycin esterase family protein [Streptomyces sp. DSM 41635]MDT0401120.1 erythromycin esterase family protein [Streptomyces sp. DSM 41635]